MATGFKEAINFVTSVDNMKSEAVSYLKIVENYIVRELRAFMFI